tara:strand:+ start:1313 stop:1861 length:549 start_codon:yes stop_codon:yes gene_type:complete
MIKEPFKNKGFAVWLSKLESDVLIECAPHNGAKIAIMLGLCGLRVHEICKIQNEDKFRDPTIGLMAKVIGKGGKYRNFPLDSRLEFADFSLTNVETRTITNWFRFSREEAAKRTGDSGYLDCTMHDLRRSWCIQALSKQILPETIKLWGGWSSSSTVFENHYVGAGIKSADLQKVEREKLGY